MNIFEQPTRILAVGAHPDDIEVMVGHLTMQPDAEAYALVASYGRQGEHRHGQDYLCRRWRPFS